MRAGGPTFLVLVAGAVLAASESRSAAQIVWRHDMQEAIREAERLDRPLLVRFSASWCTHCSRMEWRTFRDEQVVAHVNGSFVPLELDADANEETLESLGVKLLPTTLVLTADLKEVARITGYKSAEELTRDFAKIAVAKPSATERAAPGLIAPAVGTTAAAVPRYAFGGYCLASMFENETLVPGSDEHVAIHRGRRLRFASADHQRRFEADPERYWPALDGLCPVSALDDRVRRDGDPRLAIVYRDRLWLFADKEREEKFFTAAAVYYRQVR
ncbi:MAG: thioredoxin family protein [Planctomycetales bacterium]